MSEQVVEPAVTFSVPAGAYAAAAARARATGPCGPFEGIDPDGSLVSRMVGIEASKAALDAEMCALLVALTHRAAGMMDTPNRRRLFEPSREDIAAAEAAAALRWTSVFALNRVTLAGRLVNDLPATFAALAAGHIDLVKARIVADATECLDPGLARKVEDRVIGRARSQTTGELGAALRKAVIEADPAAADTRRLHARKGRSVRIYPLADDMAALHAALGAEDAVAIYQRIDRLARGLGAADDRTMDQRRADILTDLIHGRPLNRWLPPEPDQPDQPEGPDGPDGPDEPTDPYDPDQGDTVEPDERVDDQGVDDQGVDDQGVDDQGVVADDTTQRTTNHQAAPEPAPPSPSTAEPAAEPTTRPAEPAGAGEAPLDLTASRATLNGTSDTPGELAGYGPITAGTTRDLATSGRANIRVLEQLQRQVQELRDRVWDTYHPPPRLADAVKARDGTCRFPGCRQPARRCDLDHTIPYPRGPTALWNLGCLCRRHHLLKTYGIWRAVQTADGVLHWTSPTGRRYTTYPRGPAS